MTQLTSGSAKTSLILYSMEDWRNEYWETLCPKADKAVAHIFNSLYQDKIDSRVAMMKLVLIPFEFKDSELAKETVNKFIDHAVESLNLYEDCLIEDYQNEMTRVGLAKWTYDIAKNPLTNNSFEDFWSETKNGYIESEWSSLRKLCQEVWSDTTNGAAMTDNFIGYWKNKNKLS